MNDATVFMYEQNWLKGEACIDVRFDAQALPGGVIGIGFMMWEASGVRELIAWPYLTTDQRRHAEYIVNCAREVLRGERHDFPAGLEAPDEWTAEAPESIEKHHVPDHELPRP